MDRDRLREYLAARVPAAGEIVVGRLERTGGGASRETWLVDAEWNENGKRSLRPIWRASTALIGASLGWNFSGCHHRVERRRTPRSNPGSASERMRSLVPALARAVWGTTDEPWLELDAAIRAYARNQHRRDRQIVQVGAVAW